MRRQMMVFSVVAFAVLAPLTGPAHAQFPLSPRGILGAVTRPLRGLFGHHHYRTERHRPAEHATASEPAAKPANDRSSKNQVEPNAVADRSNPSDVVFGYAFWPNNYSNDFARYGFGTIATAIVGPLTAAPMAGRRRQLAIMAETTGSASSARRDFLPSCDVGDSATGDWVSGQIRREVRPTPAQLAALDSVRNQLIEGTTAIRSRCRASNSDSPLERLAELKQRIWAIHDADILARPSIKAFYDTLTDRQKAAFKNAAPPPLQNRNGAPMGERYQACAMAGGGTAQGLIDTIAGKVQPTGEQQASLDNFGKVSAQMEKMLLASCAQQPADNPLGRLDAADDRLVTINYAASNMEIALNAFYSTLTDNQKAHFDASGREAAR